MSTLVSDTKPLTYHPLCYQLRCQLYGNELNRFLRTNNGDKYHTKSIHLLDNIAVELSLFPNGCTNKDESYVQCLLIIPQLLSSQIRNITIRFQLFCYQTSTSFEDVKIFTHKRIGIGWPSKSLKLSKCKQYNQLDFICNLEILQIRYHKPYIEKSYYKRVQTHELVIVSWNINDTFFNRMKSETFGKLFYSKQIANYWRVAISPNYSYNTLMINCNLSFYLILDLLPPSVKSITVLFKLECPEIGVKHSKISRFSYKQRINAWPLVYLANDDYDQLKFIFTIKILKINSINNTLIPVNRWANYGINNELLFGETYNQETDITSLDTAKIEQPTTQVVMPKTDFMNADQHSQMMDATEKLYAASQTANSSAQKSIPNLISKRLERNLKQRPSIDETMSRGILMFRTDTKLNYDLQQRHKQLHKRKASKSLEKLLLNRPTLNALQQKGIFIENQSDKKKCKRKTSVDLDKKLKKRMSISELKALGLLFGGKDENNDAFMEHNAPLFKEKDIKGIDDVSGASKASSTSPPSNNESQIVRTNILQLLKHKVKSIKVIDESMSKRIVPTPDELITQYAGSNNKGKCNGNGNKQNNNHNNSDHSSGGYGGGYGNNSGGGGGYGDRHGGTGGDGDDKKGNEKDHNFEDEQTADNDSDSDSDEEDTIIDLFFTDVLSNMKDISDNELPERLSKYSPKVFLKVRQGFNELNKELQRVSYALNALNVPTATPDPVCATLKNNSKNNKNNTNNCGSDVNSKHLITLEENDEKQQDTSNVSRNKKRKKKKNKSNKNNLTRKQRKKLKSQQMYVRVNNQPHFDLIEAPKQNVYISNKLIQTIKNQTSTSMDNVRNYMNLVFEIHHQNKSHSELQLLDFGFMDREIKQPLYCSLAPQTHSCGQYKLKDSLHVSETLKTSTYKFKSFNSKYNQVINVMKKLNTENILKNCNWDKIPIVCRKDNKFRMTLTVTKEQLAIREKQFNGNEIKLIPIIGYDQKQVDFAWIIKIDAHIYIAIALSFTYEKQNGYIEINGIYIDKKDLLIRHYSAYPSHMSDCKCLNEFESIINDINIGNCDGSYNKIKHYEATSKKNGSLVHDHELKASIFESESNDSRNEITTNSLSHSAVSPMLISRSNSVPNSLPELSYDQQIMDQKSNDFYNTQTTPTVPYVYMSTAMIPGVYINNNNQSHDS